MSDDDLDLIEDEKLKELLKEARQGKKEIAEERKALEAERRAVVFDRLGIPEDGPGLMFRETYQGNSDAESVRTAAEKYKVIGAPAPSNEQLSQEDELRRLQSSQQNVGDGGQVPHAEDEIRAQMMKIDQSSLSPDEKVAALMEIVRQNNLRMDTSEEGSSRFISR